MKLTDLNPKFLDSNHFDKGVGVMFDCPCGCGNPCYVPFKNPIAGQPCGDDIKYARALWQRDGESFETMTLTPSVWRKAEHGGCGWHGVIKNGDVTAC